MKAHSRPALIDLESPVAAAAREPIAAAVAAARRSMRPRSLEVDVIEAGQSKRFLVTRRGLGPILHNDRYSWQVHLSVSDIWGEYNALIAADRLDAEGMPLFADPSRLLLRVDSGCYTGQVFLDESCECRQQLHAAIELIEATEGIIIAVPRQDGRGMGLDFKLGTLAIQKDAGADTVDAARALAHGDEIDVRSYGGIVAVLKFLSIHAGTGLRLITNNDLKVDALAENGYVIVERVPLRIPSTKHTARHLLAKRVKLGHDL